MSRFGSSPEGFEIAALKKRQTELWDPMAPGPGTPWEDRATHGIVGAFLRTCAASITGPGKLATSIRRPETTGDVRSFVVGCGLLWGVSTATCLAMGLWAKSKGIDLPKGYKVEAEDVSGLWAGLYLLVAFAATTVGVVGLWMLYSAVYNRLVQQEARPVKLTEPLMANVVGYAFGPAILAPLSVVAPLFPRADRTLVGLVGPLLAVALMLIAMITTGTSTRLRLRLSAAAVDAVLGLAALVAIAAAGSFVSTFVNYLPVPDPVPLVDIKVQEANGPTRL